MAKRSQAVIDKYMRAAEHHERKAKIAMERFKRSKDSIVRADKKSLAQMHEAKADHYRRLAKQASLWL